MGYRGPILALSSCCALSFWEMAGTGSANAGSEQTNLPKGDPPNSTEFRVAVPWFVDGCGNSLGILEGVVTACLKEMIPSYRALPHWFVIVASLFPTAPAQALQALFDAHLHYNLEDAAQFTPEAVISRLRSNGIQAALVTSRPPEKVLQLQARAPDLILPMLGVYRTPADKATWMHDAGLPGRVEEALARGPWRGVGELHLFAEDRRRPVFVRIARLASARGLPLQLHCDPAVIDALFEQVPNATVIWAHAGAYPYPALLRDYLQRYPGLYIDLSVRDERVAPGGEIDPEWELLLMEFPKRFMVGVDTYRTERWQRFAEAAGQIRAWLAQLPEEVSTSIAHRNALHLFGLQVED